MAHFEPAWVETARAIATEAHRGQVDKTGADYILHPARVAARIDPRRHPVEHAAAWLHDVVEDTGTTPEELGLLGIPDAVIEVVLLLTRRDDVPDADYYAAIAADPRALMVKRADLDDNTDPARTAALDDATRDRLAAKYAKARAALGISG